MAARWPLAGEGRHVGSPGRRTLCRQLVLRRRGVGGVCSETPSWVAILFEIYLQIKTSRGNRWARLCL
jgi:hypothetical protein